MVDWLVVSLHFGYEYQHFPSPRDVKLCRELIDCGADIILGHHPHYPQGVETYNNGIIAYSLGNFIWDQNFVGHTASSFLLEIQLSKTRIVSMEAVPFTLDKTYRLQYNYSAIDEINELSKVVINKRKHEREWYFIARNKLVEFARILKSTIIKDGFTAENIYKFCSNRFSPRFIYVAKSFLFFVLTGKAIYYEISKLVLKLIK